MITVPAASRPTCSGIDPDPYPQVERVFVGGREVYRAGPIASSGA